MTDGEIKVFALRNLLVEGVVLEPSGLALLGTGVSDHRRYGPLGHEDSSAVKQEYDRRLRMWRDLPDRDGALAAIRRKVQTLLGTHRVLVVKPIVVRKLLVSRSTKGGW